MKRKLDHERINVNIGPAPDFRLNGYNQHPLAHTGLMNKMIDSMTIWAGRLRFQLGYAYTLECAAVWGSHIIAEPHLPEHTRRLMREETEVATTEDNKGIKTRISGQQWHVVEFDLLNGRLKLEDMPSEYLFVLDKFEGLQMTKLLTYQYILRTIVRVKSRCAVVCADAPECLNIGLTREGGVLGIVCEYLGQTGFPRWYGSSYDDIWTARVKVKAKRGEAHTQPTLPVPGLLGVHHVEYIKIDSDFWKVPW
jgi:hypothetical protein